MRKFLITLIIFLSLLIGLLYFSTTEYFFNKYIAPIVNEYNFNYKSVKGTLDKGFIVKDLSYKDKDLASVVELKFNPLKLFLKRVAINRLKLKNVNKETLKLIIDDFKKESNSSKGSSKSTIGLNFEFKNIYLTFKPFKLENLVVKKNILKIKEFTYINGKIYLAKNHYYYNTNLGIFEFDGRYKNKILNIDKIYLESLDIQKVAKFINSFDNNNTKSENNNSNILFLPNIININKLYASLKPFKYKNINITKAKLNGQNLKIDIMNKKLKELYIALNLKTDISDFDTKLILKNQNLVITNIELALLNANSLVKFIDSFSNKKIKNNSSSFELLSFIPLKNLTVNNISLLVKNFNFKDNRIKNITLNSKKFNYDFNKSKLTLSNLNINAKTSLANIQLKGSVKRDINIDKLSIKSSNVNKIISFIDSLDNNNSNSSSFKIDTILPNNIFLKDANIEFKNLSFLPYKITNGSIKAKNTLFNIDNNMLKSGFLSIKNNSNWGVAELNGSIKNNNFYAKGFAKINKNLTKEFSLPLKSKNIEPINVSGRFGFKDLELNASLKGNDILTVIDGVDIEKSTNKLYYNYSSNELNWNIDANIKSVFLPLSKIKNTLIYKENKLSYSGNLKPKELPKISKEFAEILNNLSLKYSGNSDGIDLKATTDYLEAKLYAKKYKQGVLEFKNIKNIDLSKALNLKDATISKLLVTAPIKFENTFPLNGKIFLKSTLIDAKGNWEYNKNLIFNGVVLNSRIFPKDINKKVIFPTKLNLEYKKKLTINLKNNLLHSNIIYEPNSGNINAELISSSLSAKARGDSSNIFIKVKSNSISKSLKEINKIYKLNSTPNVQGALNVELNTNFKDFNYLLYSNKLEITNKKSKTIIKDINIEGSAKKERLEINRYRVNINGFKFYADNKSIFNLKNNLINIESFYINNKAVVKGVYNIKNSSGKLKLKANSFKFNNSDYSINTNLNLDININKNHYKIAGLVDLINATIKKNLENRNAAQSDDIIILQRQAEKKSTFYVKNINLNIKVKSQKGVLYAQNGSHFIVYPKLKINKNFNNFTKMRGSVILSNKSYYIFKDKKFYVKRGKITFRGKSSVAYLNILMHYKGMEYDVYVNVTGTSSRPIIFFSSNPPLTKEQILAYLLFNDTSAAGSHSQNSMLNLVGGVLAKSFFGSIGLKIDKLSIKENGFSIGKAINDKVIIYYNQDSQKPSIKARIDITKSIHSVIEVGEQKKSADIIFSREY